MPLVSASEEMPKMKSLFMASLYKKIKNLIFKKL